MDKSIALERLRRGEDEIKKNRPTVERRQRYVDGEHDLPYAPEGVNAEYQDLREQAVANYLGIAMSAPVQRLRADGIRTKLPNEADADKKIWAAWQANKLDTRQSVPYASMMQHGRGIVSVWPNRKNKKYPIARPEDFANLYIHPDPDDPWTPQYVVKIIEVEEGSRAGEGLILPTSVLRTKSVGLVYDGDSLARFERGGLTGTGEWELVLEGTHPMRSTPFAMYDFRPTASGSPRSALDALIPQQDAINTIRFNTLLAMQFSAYRQRIVTGFDPRITDKDGNIVYRRNEDGTPMVDGNGNAVPMLNTMGRVGVDRLLVFPGEQTKVFDLAESNLKNYVDVLEFFLVQFFSTAQIPPQYLLTQMANLSGDALAGAESTLASLVKELQLAAGEGNESVAELMWYAMGESDEFSPEAETNWADAEARSFAQIIDAIVKLVSVDFPKRAAFEMIPGATMPKVDRWMEMVEDEAFANRLALAGREFVDATALPADPAGGAIGAPAELGG